MLNRVWIFLAGVFTGLLAAGLVILVSGQPAGQAIVLPPVPSPAPVVVYVSGEVFQPGTYSLPPGSRVGDAITAAGGMTSLADPSTINLAANLMDGQHLQLLALRPEGIVLDRSFSVELVNLNTATQEQLETLPEIGEITARAIIAYRETYGRFEKLDDVMYVDGIGPVTLEKIRPFVIIE